MDAPIFNEVLSSGQWRKPKPEVAPAPPTIREMMEEDAKSREAAGLDWDDPWPHEEKK